MKCFCKKAFAVIVFSFLMAATKVQATIIFVDVNSTEPLPDGASWATAFNDVQAAIDIAVDGDELWVAQGTYMPAYEGLSFYMKSGVKIYGGFTGIETMLSERNWVTNITELAGNMTTVIINSEVDATARLDGFTVKWGNAGYGGYGLGHGGGMHNENSSPVITNVIFINNAAIDGANGGGMYNNGSSPTLTNVTFDSNQTYTGSGYGGGMANENGSAPVLEHVIFKNNFVSVGGRGGGMSNINSSPVLTRVVFDANESDAGYGGAMYNYSSSPVINNSVFAGNIVSAGGSGGGIYNLFFSNPILTNVTFAGNFASGGSGGAMLNDDQSLPVITNSLFWRNEAVEGHDIHFTDVLAVPDINYSFTQTVFTGIGNITGSYYPFEGGYSDARGSDGLYMTADDPLRLSTCSNGINAADNTLNTATTDIAGQSRIYNTIIDMGAYEHQDFPTGITMAEDYDESFQTVYTRINTILAQGACRIIAGILPNGSNPLTGNVMFNVWIDPSVQIYAGQPYVQRHYDITPASGAPVKTANVKLFFTQEEFNAFNLVSTLALPTESSDAAGISNLRVMQFHGTSLSGIPGTYNGFTENLNPADADITWNNSLSRWEVAFDVTNFSGFIVTTNGTTLPLQLLSFTGKLVNSETLLEWKTGNEINTSHFEVEKSIDGINFYFLSRIIANGSGNNYYNTKDPQPKPGNNYYRLRSVDNDGKHTYSKSVLVRQGINGKAQLRIYPNPASKELIVNYNNENRQAQISIYSLDGRKVLTTTTNHSAQTTIDVSNLTVGTYLIELSRGGEILRDVFVKIKM